ncbi:MAG: hypothetical protein DRI81_19825 [Chloroflexi bacterium]|nr:MAG: hypothetical protein DRI81_19825 [Chloroflexota bacterium]
MGLKWIGGLLALALAGLLAACSVFATPTATPRPTPVPITALEAYERARPVMLSWHEDAVITRISARLGHGSWYVSNDGKASIWLFHIDSARAKRHTSMSVSTNHVYYGTEKGKDIPMDETRLQNLAHRVIPIDELMDTDEAVTIALQSGVVSGDRLTQIELRRHGDEETRFWWVLEYGEHPLPGQWIHIDARTGEVGRNDFAE